MLDPFMEEFSVTFSNLVFWKNGIKNINNDVSDLEKATIDVAEEKFRCLGFQVI